LSIVANEQVARGLGGIVDIRVLLHRTTSYPVVVLVLGPPAALRVPSPSQLVAITLDVGAEGSDRDALVSLAASFHLLVHLDAPPPAGSSSPHRHPRTSTTSCAPSRIPCGWSPRRGRRRTSAPSKRCSPMATI